jgi:folylpolyglutamate synthase/dihydropteroate synthase
VTRVQSERSASPSELTRLCRKANPAAQLSEFGDLKTALGAAAAEPFVVVTGSLYLIGEARVVLESQDRGNERGLNEWGERQGSD